MRYTEVHRMCGCWISEPGARGEDGSDKVHASRASRKQLRLHSETVGNTFASPSGSHARCSTCYSYNAIRRAAFQCTGGAAMDWPPITSRHRAYAGTDKNWNAPALDTTRTGSRKAEETRGSNEPAATLHYLPRWNLRSPGGELKLQRTWYFLSYATRTALSINDSKSWWSLAMIQVRQRRPTHRWLAGWLACFKARVRWIKTLVGLETYPVERTRQHQGLWTLTLDVTREGPSAEH